MNILVVHEVSYLKKVVYEYQDFAERLAARGHRVSVIDYDATGDGEYGKAECSKTGLGRVVLENTPHLNLPFVKYVSGRWNYPKLLEPKLRQGAVDVVLLYSIFVNGTSTIRLCRKYGVPVVYRVLDIYHKIRGNPLMAVPLYFAERFTYRNADVVCVTNEKLRGYVERLAGARRLAPVSVIHHGVDLDFFKPLPRDPEFAARHGIRPEDRVALFLGTTYTFSGLDRLLAGFAKLRAHWPQLKIVVVGGGDLDGKLAAMVARLGLRHDVILAGSQPYQEVPRWISLADVAFNSFRVNDVTRDVIPIKLLQYLACAKPVVCTPMPDVMRLFPERESGMVYCDIGKTEDYLRLLARIAFDPGENQALARDGLAFVTAHFSMQSQIAKLEALLSETARKRAGAAPC